LTLLMIVGISLLLLPACRRQAAEGGVTAVPTLTPTPRSTPLPAIATAIPPGAVENPLQMVVRPDGSMSAARAAIDAVETAILEIAGVAVDIELVERYGEALAALCQSSEGRVSVVWLNGASYVAARAENCGVPVLQVERGTRRDARTGEGAAIIVNGDENISTLSALRDRSFCRLAYDDFYTWLAPSLILRASGLNLSTTAGEITDYDDLPSLIQAVADGDCDAAGIPANALETYADDLGDAVEQVDVLTTTTVEFPYAVLVLPPEVPLGTRIALNDALVEMAADNTYAPKLRDLLGQNALLPAAVDDFAELETFMSSTGLDFAQLGN
jgi:ABC-type phosphate/phosphonate transport system substrate-binding protein